MPQVGPRKKREKAETGDIRALYLINHPHCEVGVALRLSEFPEAVEFASHYCWVEAKAVHERVKRSAGGSLTNPANLLSTCFPCNGFIEDHPKICKAIGLVVHSKQNPDDVPVVRHHVLQPEDIPV